MQNPSCVDTLPQTAGFPALRPAVKAIPRGQVEVLTQIGKAEHLWRELVQQGAICSRYQHYSWMSHWWNQIGSRGGTEPHIAVLRNEAGQSALLLPLLRKRLGPIHAGFFMGGKHANFNLPIWRPEQALDLDTLLKGLKHSGPRLDVLVLLNQPAMWRGAANPMLQAPHTASASFAYGGSLQEDFEALQKERMSPSSRKKLRNKERQLAAAGPVSCHRARTGAEIDQVLEAFFRHKSERMRELGINNVFEAPGVKNFIAAAAHDIDSETGAPVIELYAAKAGDTIVATFGGVVADGRFSGMFTSIAGAEFRRYSPGELLLSNLVRMCCARGLDKFDLGIGEAIYKQEFCSDAEALYDSVIPLTAAGHAAAPLWRGALALKVRVKQSDWLLRKARPIQKLISGSNAA